MSKMKFLCKVLAGAVSVLFISCSATTGGVEKSAVQKGEPDWVNGLPASYPEKDYLFASGHGNDRRSAELDAVGELVALFGQNINSASTSSNRMELAQKDGLVATASASSLDQTIFRDVNQNDIVAVDIPEFYESKKDGKYYALAVMSRAKGTQLYSAMIEKNQNQISSIINQIYSEKEPNTLQNYSRLDFAEEIAVVNESYLKRLLVINTLAAKKYDSYYSPIQIRKKKNDMATKIPICVSVTEDSDGRVAKTFQEVIGKEGFYTTAGTNERYKLLCKLHLNKNQSSDGKTFFCEYSAEASLLDTFTGETIIPMNVSGREGSPNYENAVVRSKQKVVSKIKNEFSVKFKEFLGGN